MYRLDIPSVYVPDFGGKVTVFPDNTVGKKRAKKVEYYTKHIKKSEKREAFLTENHNVFRIRLFDFYLLYNLY